jgi:hypothetical protein
MTRDETDIQTDAPQRFPVSVAAAASIAAVLLAVAAASWAGDANWLYLGVLAIGVGSIGGFFALRYRRWLAATLSIASAIVGVWMLVAISNWEGT